MNRIHDERLARVALSFIPALGPRRTRRLLDRFGSAEEVLRTPPVGLREVEGVGKVLAERIAAPDLMARAERRLDGARRRGVRVLIPEDEAYPSLLEQIEDPPVVLWVRGTLPRREVRVAVVGTRRVTEYGVRMARKLGRDLARRAICVVSGLALGADASAHRGALETGRTVGVMATGPDRIYPSRHRELAGRIAEAGALITEFGPGTPARRGNFPARNRIISGLCRGTVVVESRLRGGSMITGYLASDQNRELFAVPGRVGTPTSEGPNDLIRRGYAKLVERVEDVVEEIAAMVEDGAIRALAEEEASADAVVPPHLRSLYEALAREPGHVDELARRMRVDVSSLLVQLFELEAAGLVRQLSGRQFACR